jgi:hypothetical protein
VNQVSKVVRKPQLEQHEGWVHLLTGIDRSAGLGNQRSRLLHPDFPVIQGLGAMSTILLVYVAAVVQVEVGFYWHEGLCAKENGPLEIFDVFVDFFFIVVSHTRHWTPQRDTQLHPPPCYALS